MTRFRLARWLRAHSHGDSWLSSIAWLIAEALAPDRTPIVEGPLDRHDRRAFRRRGPTWGETRGQC